jgi:hypothetical protein
MMMVLLLLSFRDDVSRLVFAVLAVMLCVMSVKHLHTLLTKQLLRFE